MSTFQSTWPFLSANSRGDYTPLEKESNPDESQTAIPKPHTRSSPLTWRRVLDIAPWLSTLLFAISALWLLYERSQPSPLGAFATGWTTDFISSRSAIEVQQVRFTGSPSFYDNNTMYIPNPDPVQYVGEPSALVDQNWDTLTWGRYILITEDEARATWGDDVDDFWDDQRGGYVAG
ncbi:hypothetical protein BDR22DRAFT_886178 [Usnea florida]